MVKTTTDVVRGDLSRIFRQLENAFEEAIKQGSPEGSLAFVEGLGEVSSDQDFILVAGRYAYCPYPADNQPGEAEATISPQFCSLKVQTGEKITLVRETGAHCSYIVMYDGVAEVEEALRGAGWH